MATLCLSSTISLFRSGQGGISYRSCSLLRIAPIQYLLTRNYGSKKQSRPWKQKPNRNPRLRIILTEDVPNLGGKSQLVRVKRGYGRNVLIPEGRAVYATSYNIEKYGISQDELKGNVESSKTDSISFITKYLEDKTLIVRQDPEVYKWCLRETAISKAFYSCLQLYVPVDSILMEKPITEFGPSSVKIQLTDDHIVPVDVEVVSYVSSKLQRKRDKKLAKHVETVN